MWYSMNNTIPRFCYSKIVTYKRSGYFGGEVVKILINLRIVLWNIKKKY